MRTGRATIGVLMSFLAVGCDEPADYLNEGPIGASISPTAPREGAACTVQFRRDLLGAARELPVPPTTDSMNGAEVSLAGRFLRMDDDWIVLERGEGEQVWIPREVVLLLRVSEP